MTFRTRTPSRLDFLISSRTSRRASSKDGKPASTLQVFKFMDSSRSDTPGWIEMPASPPFRSDDGISSSKLVFLFLEQNVERGQGTVAARDVLLQLNFFAVGELFVSVDLLLQHAQVIPHHHDFVEKGFERHFLGLQCRVGGMHEQFAAVPADAKFFNHGIRLFQTEPD